VSRDKHLRVRYSHRPLPERAARTGPTAEEREQHRNYLNRINYGFERIERLPGNIGYMDFRGFTDPELGAETVAAAFNFLANTDGLIIDLRQNGGGTPGMVALISSYLFGPEPVHLNDLYWREGDRTDQFWTLKEVPGRRYAGKDVYVLTSNRTFSGAEEFSYNLKNLKRATIVGEATGGGAHPGGVNRLHAHFSAFIPTGRAINPITKSNWEGTGVEPDVKVPAAQALKVAHLAALKKAAEKATDPELKGALQGLIERTQKELGDMQAQK
jgi:C-terminal processing protease CtpA/Prc